MFVWFIPLNQTKQCVTKKIKRGILTQGLNCNIECFNHTHSMNCKSKWFLTIKSARFSINIFSSTSSFLKGSFEAKNPNMEELKIFALFCASCVSKFSFTWQLISSWNFLKIIGRSASRCFYKHVLPLILCYDIKPFFNCFLGFFF